MNRREFLKRATSAGSAAALVSPIIVNDPIVGIPSDRLDAALGTTPGRILPPNRRGQGKSWASDLAAIRFMRYGPRNGSIAFSGHDETVVIDYWRR